MVTANARESSTRAAARHFDPLLHVLYFGDIYLIDPVDVAAAEWPDMALFGGNSEQETASNGCAGGLRHGGA